MSEEFAKAFASCGYDGKYAKVSISNRPDLCEYQCNGAMAAAKEYKKAPFMIADEIVSYIKESGNTEMFSMIEMVKPGFINLVLSPAFLAGYAEQMAADAKLGYERSDASCAGSGKHYNAYGSRNMPGFISGRCGNYGNFLCCVRNSVRFGIKSPRPGVWEQKGSCHGNRIRLCRICFRTGFIFQIKSIRLLGIRNSKDRIIQNR